MLEKTFPQHNLRVVDLVELIRKHADIDIVNDLHFYGLLEQSRITKDIKKLMYHYIATAICNCLMKSEGFEKIVFYFNPTQIKSEKYPAFDLAKYLPQDKFVEAIEKIVKHIAKTLPVKIYTSNWAFDIVIIGIENHTGEGIELLYRLKQIAVEINDVFTFARTLKFTLNNNLVALQKLFKSPARTRLLLA